jgi:iron complex outermembrane receptor protein
MNRALQQRRSPSLTLKFVLAGLCALPVAFAQDKAGETQDPDNQLKQGGEEIVELQAFTVSAQKTPRTIQEVPMAVVAVDSTKMSDFKIFNVQDVQNVSPGLDVKTTDARNPIPSLRGITFNPDSGTSAAVDVYWNETAVGASTGFRSLYDVGQIEVLRGPQGTLRGRSSPGGAITIATRKPNMSEFGASIEQSFSDQNLVNTQAAINIPVLKDKLAVRIAGLYDGNDGGRVKDIITGKEDSSHTRSFRATIEWKPNENVDLTFVHQYLHQILYDYPAIEGTPTYSKAMPSAVKPIDRISVSPGPASYEDTPVTDSLTGVFKLPGRHEITMIAGYQDLSTHVNVEYTNLANIIPGYTSPQKLDVSSKTHTYELRLSSVEHEKWNYIFGAYYETSKSNVYVKQAAVRLWFDGANPYVSSSPIPRAPDMEVGLNLSMPATGSYRGLFMTHTLQLTRKLKLEAGVRYQQIKSDSAEYDAGLGINSKTSRDEKPTTGSASLTYQVSKQLNTYFTYGRSYRPGGQGFRTDAAELEKYLHYKPETSDGFELGMKSTWLRNRLQFNADVFYQKFKDYISHSGFVYADSNFDGYSDNVYGITFNGDAESKGLEASLAASLPRHVIVGVDLSYADATWTKALSPTSLTNAYGMPIFNTPGDQVSYTKLDGKRLGDTPRFNLSAHIEWSKKISSFEIFTRGLFNYKSSRELLNVPNPHIGGGGTLDAFAGLRSPDGKWNVTLWAKNAFDRETISNRATQTSIGSWLSGYTAVRIAPSRELGVTMSYRF